MHPCLRSSQFLQSLKTGEDKLEKLLKKRKVLVKNITHKLTKLNDFISLIQEWDAVQVISARPHGNDFAKSFKEYDEIQNEIGLLDDSQPDIPEEFEDNFCKVMAEVELVITSHLNAKPVDNGVVQSPSQSIAIEWAELFNSHILSSQVVNTDGHLMSLQPVTQAKLQFPSLSLAAFDGFQIIDRR